MVFWFVCYLFFFCRRRLVGSGGDVLGFGRRILKVLGYGLGVGRGFSV